MTPTEYRTALADAGLTQVGAARLFRVNGRTSRSWASGRYPIPHVVAMILRLLASGRIGMDDLAAVSLEMEQNR